MDFYQVLEGRSSIRAFLPKQVDERLLEKILQAAGHSPSYMNTQPWEVFVVMGKKKEELCAALSEAAQEDEPKRPDFPLPTVWPEPLEKRLSAHRRNRFAALGVDTSDQKKIYAGYLRNFQLYGAPCGVFVGLDKTLTSWSMFDLGLFVHGFLMVIVVGVQKISNTFFFGSQRVFYHRFSFSSRLLLSSQASRSATSRA